MSRQAEAGGAKQSQTGGLVGSIRLFGGRERSEQPNQRMGTAAAPFSGGQRSEMERSVR
jgi:hypothetical protein